MMTTAKQAGGCQCGFIRYDCPAEPTALYVCHCRECQRQSSSAFGISVIVPTSEVLLRSGEPKSFTRKTDSGGELECVFCPKCGTRLWHRRSAAPQNVSVKGGTLDMPISIQDAIHIWTDKKLDGVNIPAGTERWPGEPVD